MGGPRRGLRVRLLLLPHALQLVVKLLPYMILVPLVFRPHLVESIHDEALVL